MGQKITEHPAVDNWVKLMKEVDRTGATSHHAYRRKAKDAKEWSDYGQMQVARTRSWIGIYGSVREVRHSTLCLECGSVLGDITGQRPRKQVWDETGHTDYYLCARCSGRE
jgi:hypothetical protein